MYFKNSAIKKKVPFIDISSSFSDSSKENIVYNPKHLSEIYNFTLPCSKSQKENQNYSSSSNDYNPKLFTYKFNSSDNLLSKIQKKNEILPHILLYEDEKDIYHKKEKNDKNKEELKKLFYNKINKKNELYTPNKNIQSFNYNIINKNKVFNSNVNYEGKNLNDLFDKIKIKKNKDKINLLFSPNQKVNKNLITLFYLFCQKL